MFEIRNGLTWVDWCYTSQNKLAIRHLDNSNYHLVQNELKNGGKGDGCSLVIPGLNSTSSNIDIAHDEKNPAVSRVVDYVVEQLLKQRWPELKISSLHYKNDLISFRNKLENSTTLQEKKIYLTSIFNLFLADWVRQCQQLNPSKNFYFIIIIHPDADKPFDFRSGYPLGKCGSGSLWKVHEKMTQAFTFEASKTFESNFSNLAGRIQNFRTQNVIREFPDVIEDSKAPYYVFGLGIIAIVGIIFIRSKMNISQEK